jgi:altronate dehydratase
MLSKVMSAGYVLASNLANPHQLKNLLTPRRREQGSVTIENVIWAVAVIGIAAIVTAAIINFVTNKAGEITG